MSRRARSRLLAREMKRGETYAAIGPEEDDDFDPEGGSSDGSHSLYRCTCCSRQKNEYFWCGICSAGATLETA